MNSTRHSIFRCLLPLAIFAAGGAVCAQPLPRIYEAMTVELPPRLEALLITEYPDYHVPTVRDFYLTLWNGQFVSDLVDDSPEIRLMRERYENAQREITGYRNYVFESPASLNSLFTGLPYVCWGDFNGDGLTDIALILLRNSRSDPDSGSTQDEQLIVAFHNTNAGYAAFELSRGGKSIHWGQYLDTQAPWKVLTVKGKGYGIPPDDPMPEFVELDHDAIILGFEGKSSSLLYWEDNQYKRVLISD
ncbi:hypothetical protein KKC97_04975 [bacterium]|nr:hypothetical protein [bacterium]